MCESVHSHFVPFLATFIPFPSLFLTAFLVHAGNFLSFSCCRCAGFSCLAKAAGACTAVYMYFWELVFSVQTWSEDQRCLSVLLAVLWSMVLYPPGADSSRALTVWDRCCCCASK